MIRFWHSLGDEVEPGVVEPIVEDATVVLCGGVEDDPVVLCGDSEHQD